MTGKSFLIYVSLLLLVSSSMGCLGGRNTGDLKLIFDGTDNGANMTLVIANGSDRIVKFFTVKEDESREYNFYNMTPGNYRIDVTYYGRLQERRIIQIVQQEVTTVEFTIYDKRMLQ